MPGPTINRYRAVWSGFPGGPGVSTFYQLTVPGTLNLNTPIRTFFEGCKTLLPTNVTITYQAQVDQLDSTTGKLVGSISNSVGAATVGTLGQVYSAPAGALVKWTTGTIADSHRLSGRTFMVPLQADSATGALSPAGVSTLQTAANAFVTAAGAEAVVWHRPKYNKDGVLVRNGSTGAITGALVTNKYTVLRSRRD